MNNEKYLNKIKKLLTLAKRSTNPHEAAAALARAQKMMAEHRVQQSDVDFMDINEATSKGAPNNAQTPPKYLQMLTSLIGHAFGVKCYSTLHAGWTRKRTVTFFGPDERPQVALYAFDVLSRQLVAARRIFISSLRKNIKPATKTGRADVFCEGWCGAVYHLLTPHTITEAEETLMQAYREKMELEAQEFRESGAVSGKDNAFSSGCREGLKATLHQGVNGSSTGPLLIGGGS